MYTYLYHANIFHFNIKEYGLVKSKELGVILIDRVIRNTKQKILIA